MIYCNDCQKPIESCTCLKVKALTEGKTENKMINPEKKNNANKDIITK